MNASPFVPFRVLSRTGVVFIVTNPRLVAVTPSGRRMVIAQEDDSVEIVDVQAVEPVA